MLRTHAVLGLMVVALVTAGCGKKETPFERVTRLRQQYQVQPNGYQPLQGLDGQPSLALDILIANKGKEGLDQLTLLVQIVDASGEDRAVGRAVLDTARLLPGVTEQLSALVPGLAVGDGDGVLVELEYEPPADVLAEYPEYAGTVAPSPDPS